MLSLFLKFIYKKCKFCFINVYIYFFVSLFLINKYIFLKNIMNEWINIIDLGWVSI